MKPGQRLIVVASVLMLAGIAADSFLHLALISGLLILAAAVCIFLGVRAQRKQPAASPVSQPSNRIHRFILLLAALAVGVILGFFTLRQSQPQLSVATVLACSAVSFCIGAFIVYWRLFRVANL